MALSDIFTIMSMEVENSEDWAWDHNTTVLMIVQNNIACFLKAIMTVSENLQHPEEVDMMGLVNGMVQSLEWIQENMEKVPKDGKK